MQRCIRIHTTNNRWAATEAEPGIAAHGPITQQQFLMSMGIVERTNVLLQACTDETQRQALEGAVRRLVEGSAQDGMGETYKVLALTRASDPVPVPFGSDEDDQDA